MEGLHKVGFHRSPARWFLRRRVRAHCSWQTRPGQLPVREGKPRRIRPRTAAKARRLSLAEQMSSPEAAQECSPGRKPWVKPEDDTALKGRNNGRSGYVPSARPRWQIPSIRFFSTTAYVDFATAWSGLSSNT